MNKLLFKIIFTLGLVMISSLCVFSKDKEANKANYKDRIIKIACLPHKVFPNPDNIVKVLGAIEMRSIDEDFGGLSGLLMLPSKQKIYLLSDRSDLIIADTLINPKTHAIECLNNALIRHLRGRSTNPLSGHHGDSEGISFAPAEKPEQKNVIISFERHHRVVSYNPADEKLLPKHDYKPFDKKNLPYNESYESVLALKDKSIIAFPERYDIQDKMLRGFHLMPDGKVLKNIHLKRHGGFWLTDIGQLSNGDFITLERSFSIFRGMGLQMRHIPRAMFLSGEVADGKVIFTMKTGDGVDNFEGLDVVHQDGGTNLLYISSDNNFTSLQKTLLLSLSYDIAPSDL